MSSRSSACELVRVALGLWVAFAACLLALTPATAQDHEMLPGFKAWRGDLDGMEERRLIRILVPYSKTIYFIDQGEQFGTAVEFGKALEVFLNKGKKKEIERIRVAFVPMERDRLLPALNTGRGDIVAANLTITVDRRELADFTDPLAKGVKEILVTGPSAPDLASLDDLGGKDIFLRQSSSYFEHLTALNRARKDAGKAEFNLRPIDEGLEDEDLLEMVDAGLLPWAVVDQHKANIWSSVFEKIRLRDDLAISEGGEIAWAIRKDSPKLKSRLNAFVAEHKVGTTFGNILKKRYYQNDKMVRSAYELSEIVKFRSLRGYFEKHGASYDFNVLLLAAQGYQESQLDQSERSPRGAVGVMQLMPSTAADKAVGITGIDASADRNIEAGAKYLRHLTHTYIDDPGITPINRALFALAAYNAGPGNLRKFRKAAVDMGLDQNIWFGNVENGAAKIVGRETVQYVGNIYKYYIAYSLYEEGERQRAEVKGEALPVSTGK